MLEKTEKVSSIFADLLQLLLLLFLVNVIRPADMSAIEKLIYVSVVSAWALSTFIAIGSWLLIEKIPSRVWTFLVESAKVVGVVLYVLGMLFILCLILAWEKLSLYFVIFAAFITSALLWILLVIGVIPAIVYGLVDGLIEVLKNYAYRLDRYAAKMPGARRK